MGNKLPLIRGRRLRVTKLDGCGARVLGPDSMLVTKGFITVGMTANNEEGDPITQTNANGENCILDQPVPKFLNFTNNVQMCGVDPALFTLMTGQPVVLNAAGDPVGFDVESDLDVDLLGFAMEMWTGVSVDACEEGAGVQYGYLLEPFLKGGTIGDLSIENAAINLTVSGAVTRKGSPWGNGPYDVELDELGEPGPLFTPVSNKAHLRMIPTEVPPPDETDGAAALGVPATGADVSATTAATLTPANSYAPGTLAELTADPLTATPSTAWATGKYLLLRDGSKAHWTSTVWAAGPA